jgi:hypothetical protein
VAQLPINIREGNRASQDIDERVSGAIVFPWRRSQRHLDEQDVRLLSLHRHIGSEERCALRRLRLGVEEPVPDSPTAIPTAKVRPRIQVVRRLDASLWGHGWVEALRLPDSSILWLYRMDGRRLERHWFTELAEDLAKHLGDLADRRVRASGLDDWRQQVLRALRRLA